MPKISIIMPIYNGRMYLKEALETIFAQNFLEFELICIDDCSSDKLTKDILQSYQQRYENMQIIWSEKKIGTGEARNIGFLKAKGIYTIFLDSDDLFDPCFLEKMYQCISANNADVCICGHKEFYTENGKKCFDNKYIPDEYRINTKNRENWLLDIPTAPWNKLCKTQFLKENNIFFQSLESCNDVFFSCMVMINAKKRCYIEYEPLVYYRTKTDTQISKNRNSIDLYKALMLLYDTMKTRYPNERLLQWISALLLKNGILEMRNCNREKDNLQFYDLLRKFFLQYPICFENKVLEFCRESLKRFPYESKWYLKVTEFIEQLRLTAGQIKELIGEEKVFLWGLGYRGDMFQKLCKEQKIYLEGITDKKNEYLGQESDYGNTIVSTEYVLNSGGLIIASNHEIYEYLLNWNVKVIDLDQFCVF